MRVSNASSWFIATCLTVASQSASASAQNWPAPSPAAIPGTPGYVDIPGAAIARDPRHEYKALFDAVKGPEDPAKPLASILRVARQINGLRGAQVPFDHIRFVMVMHGSAADALYTNAAYRKKYHVDNPNVALITALSNAGVRFLVCGQYLAGADIPKKDLVDQAEVAEAATLVIIRLVNEGYAVLPD